MPAVNSLRELLVEELRDIYDAEKRLTKALPKISKASSHDELKSAIDAHLEETREHVTRLEQAFDALDTPARAKTCAAMKGLIEEGDEHAGEDYADAGLKDGAIDMLKVVRESAVRLARQEVTNRPVLSSWQKVLDYCRARLAHEPTERFHLLFLDRKNVLIADEEQQRGTVDHTPVYPREVVKRALDLGASAIIMVHNHPSGDPTPSKADIAMTREVAKAAETLGLTVHDHIVIGRAGHASFKGMGLL